jgi:Skp family chaperone for outer membrane proteins
MKRNIVLPALLFLAIASTSASAQAPAPAGPPKPAIPQPTPVAPAPVPTAKIAFVDTTAFGNEKGGITRYLNAVKSVQGEFKVRTAELLSLQSRAKAIADEIIKLSGAAVVDPRTIQAKQDEGVRVEREFKYKKEQLDADFEKRYGEVVSPISAEIGKALDQYLVRQGLTMILDISKLAPAVLTMNPASDITLAFIADYNSKNP